MRVSPEQVTKQGGPVNRGLIQQGSLLRVKLRQRNCHLNFSLSRRTELQRIAARGRVINFNLHLCVQERWRLLKNPEDW
jgi:hypothetical protein